MNPNRTTQAAVCFFTLFFLLSYLGCASRKAVPEPPVATGDFEGETAGPAVEGAFVPDARESLAAGGERETISSPFGDIPLKKREKPAPAFSGADVDETATERIFEKPIEVGKDRKMAESRPKPRPKTIPGSAKPVQGENAGEKGDIVLNFDNADLYEIIRTLGEILQINYIVDPNVRGRVTIHTSGRLTREDLFPVFFQILEANGLTAIKEDSLYKIVRLKEATQLPLATRFGEDDSALPPGERLVIQIIPLEHISIQEMTKLLTPFVTAGGTIVSHTDSNTVLVVDKASNIEKVIRLINVFDVDFFDDVEHRFFRLQYLDIKETAKTVNDFITSFGSSGKDDFKLIELERINTLLLVSKKKKIFRRVEAFLEELDVPIADVEPRIFVYSVKNGSSAELSNLLNSIFSKNASDKKKKEAPSELEKPEEKPGNIPDLFPETTTRERQVKAVQGERVGPEGSGTLKGEIKITADEIRNSIIIEAIPRDYRIVQDILSKIDVLPRQVLIEVTIAEITLDASTDLGIEWRFDRGTDFVAGLQSGATLGSTGLNFTYAILDNAKRWAATVSAMAKEDKVDILSSPSVLASDNKEARINVSTEIPVASTEYTYDSSDSNLLQTNIQYRNTGVILSVTPHINEYGLVSMDVSQEVSEAADQVDIGNGETRQSFFNRSVNTTLTVKNGQTIVIGGLIRETKSDGVAGLPCLGKVPVLQYLFGRISKSVDKTELIIFITPKVIATLEDVDIVSEEFRKRINYDYEDFKQPGSH